MVCTLRAAIVEVVSPLSSRIRKTDLEDPSGRPLLTHREEAALREAAEEKARAAEAEISRLRSELDRLRKYDSLL